MCYSYVRYGSQSIKSLLVLALLFIITPTPAHAHLIGGNDFTSGITHPILGIDHLLAMVAVGIIAVQIGGHALVSVPIAFLSTMIVGWTLGILDIQLPFVETGIALSILILGGIIAVSKKLPSSVAIACTALFALFHGHAHGTEMLSAANPVLFTFGFISSTALLHIAGIITGVYAKKTALSLRLLKTSGLAISLTGIALLLGF